MAKDFKTTSEFRGYEARKDPTNVDERMLIPPSQNVLINDGEKISARPGYSLLGAANPALTPVESSFDWMTSRGLEIPMKVYNGTLQFLYSGTWRTLASGYSTSDFSFDSWWSTSEVKDLLLFVYGTAAIGMWSGGITTLASVTANTITKQGTTSWAEEGFLLAGTRQVKIGSQTYTYTGGESTTTLTGVTANPTGNGHSAGDLVYQEIRTTANKPASGFYNDIIRVLKNQVYYGDYTKREIYVSKNTDYTDAGFTVGGRIPGEGAILTLDSTPVAFAPQEEDMYISTKDGWFKTSFTLAADLTKEYLQVKRLKTNRGKSARSQASVAECGNYILYVTNDKQIDSLGRVENIDTPESRPISDPIKLELASYDMTIAPHLKYFKNQLFATFPSEGKVLIYDFDRRYWQAPQTLPVRRLGVYQDELIGHSSSTPESYYLFDEDVFSDNENPIDCRAAFSYRNYNERFWPKQFDEWGTELYLSSNCSVSLVQKYDFGGFTSTQEKIIRGNDSSILFNTTADNSLGKWPLGQNPLGSITDSQSDLPKARVIHSFDAIDFYEHQPVYSSYGVDQKWELIACGGNVRLSKNDNQIKQ
jgi:hypothetical protein